MNVKDLYQKKRSEGFTIIEVMIVLAIAGLIILIVFLAVPALQRNSRNTQIKNDVASIMGAMNEYAANNNGALPPAGGVNCSTTNGDITLNGQVYGKVRTGTTCADGTTMPTATSTVTIYLNRKCSGTGFATAATNRAFAAGYLTETSGGTAIQCQES